MTSRAEINEAWLEGCKAARKGLSRASNPYIRINSEKAQAWDQGWATK